MAAGNPGASDALDTSQLAATAGARETRSLDDRLTLLQVRMIYVALAFGLASFFFGLVYLQLINENGMWLPKGTTHPPLVVGLVEMALIEAAGLIYFWGQWAGLYKRNFRLLQLCLWLAGLLGVISVGFHIYELNKPGFPAQSAYASVFIVTEAVFTVLLAITVLVLLGLANRARLGLFEKSGIAVEAFGEFFGFMAAIALLCFLGLYVQPFFPSG